ncbi:type IV pilus biogenesis/stability protein PilW [Thalassotalea sp. PS06]|uniref:type IV pilus biogenesis/stability protein PilW n=1 Tax=Thalassotalea sp. PS06 TaxID=2594005 RepID=UPI001163A963|nr:type IV pilus biogenesis/stability protein PilW [Thalassotalea sp. PS06]QDP00387.1 type IV pilus biogenesis/stability protein PilW [Thalassotalea sp. PS06]
MQKSVKIFSAIAFGAITLVGTSGCVTQNYAEEKPVVDRAVDDQQKAKTRISLALSYLNMGNMAQAKFNLERAKEFAPKSVEVYTAFAHYFEVVSEDEQAEQAYRKALSIEGNDADTLNNFGVFLCRQERVDEAEKYFKAAIRVPSYLRISETYENIALCHLKMNNFGKAEDALERSLAHSPNRASGLLQLAQFNYAKRDYDQAGLYMSRFELATRRFTPQAMALAFKIQQKMGNGEIAENYAKMLMNMFPESDEAQRYLEDELSRIAEDKLADRYFAYVVKKSNPNTSNKNILAVKKVQPKEQKPTPVVAAVITPATTPKVLPAAQTRAEPDVPAKPAKQETPATTQTVANATTQVVSAAKPASKPNSQATTKAVSTTTPVAANVTTTATPSAVPIDGPVHIVAKGDNLYRISLKYNITISTLRRWNDLVDENINVGQAIRLSRPKK